MADIENGTGNNQGGETQPTEGVFSVNHLQNSAKTDNAPNSNNSIITFSPDTKDSSGDDTTVESPIPTLESGVLNNGGRSASSTLYQRRLSTVSKKYDIDGDGVLDETEQAMRDMDASGRGHLSNQVVYKLLKEQMAMQKELLNKKRLVIFLGCFTVILALSNLGTAWAAAMLAKDTSVDDSSGGSNTAAMVTKNGGHLVSTNSNAETFKLTPEVYPTEWYSGRKMQDVTANVLGLTQEDVTSIHSSCNNGGNVLLNRVLFAGTEHETTIPMPLCPLGTSVQPSPLEEIYEFTFADGKTLDVDCTSVGQMTMGGVVQQCVVTGNALLLGINKPCRENGHCETGYCFDQEKGAFLPPGWPGRCRCNPNTNTGCTDGKTCYFPTNITDAQGISDTSPSCFHDFDDTCNANFDCITYSCDTVNTNKCTCNGLTNYGCDESAGEECVNSVCVSP